MSKEDCVVFILQTLARDYGVGFCPAEEAILILRLLSLLEELEDRAKQRVRADLRNQVCLN
jgi:hypothetical protein